MAELACTEPDRDSVLFAFHFNEAVVCTTSGESVIFERDNVHRASPVVEWLWLVTLCISA
jgi:hypothetical protein